MKMEMVIRDCPVCGSNDESHVFAEADFDPTRWDRFAFAARKLPEYMHYRLIACPVCDLIYASPIPTLDTLAEAYREAAFDYADEERHASRTYAAFLPRLMEQLPDRVGALDIGTGTGTFLEQLLASGFTEVVGVEPSRAPLAAARSDIRPLIRHGLFRREDFAPEQFRLITCFQTIDHVYDPFALCRDANALLKEDGALFLICHDRRALSARLLGLKSPIFDIEHLQLFSARSASFLLERCGFVDIEIKTVVNRYPLHYWWKLFPLPDRPKRAALAALKKTGLGSLPISLPAGNLAAIGFKRSRKAAVTL